MAKRKAAVVDRTLKPISGPEIVIGLVGAIGTDLSAVAERLAKQFESVSYQSSLIRLSSLLHHLKKYHDLPLTPEDDYYRAHMKAGTELRNDVGRGDAMALLGVSAIKNERAEINEKNKRSSELPLTQHAFILHSLKRPEEIRTLRQIYGPSFFVISAYSSRASRIDRLCKKISASKFSTDKEQHRSTAESLVATDEEEISADLGQDVRDAFPLGDVFINCGSQSEIERGLARFIELLFGFPFHTPSPDEMGMFYAKAAALRSADLSRQVGATICTHDGDLVCVGCNDVPKALGGMYWPGAYDHRDFQLGYDPSTEAKKNILAEILFRLKESDWLSKKIQNKDIDELVTQALSGGENAMMRGARLMNALEYGRVVHAEMGALTDAARRGLAVSDTTMFVTTFPCHMCARHIVASGIRRVVYVEPYPKSMAKDLYPDSIVVDPDGQVTGSEQEKVIFEPFVGISPRQFMSFFEMPKRKTPLGKKIDWRAADAMPRLLQMKATHLLVENDAIDFLFSSLKSKKIDLVH